MFHIPAHKNVAAPAAQLPARCPGFDFELENHGSISVLTALTDAAKDWAAEHLPADAMTWGTGIVIEHRYVDDIVCGISNADLAIG